MNPPGDGGTRGQDGALKQKLLEKGTSTINGARRLRAEIRQLSSKFLRALNEDGIDGLPL